MIFGSTILTGRTYLVTGATGGAGSATARLIARCGGKVICMGRDPERVERLKNELAGGNHSAIHCTIAEQALERFERPLDGIFHAAGSEHMSMLGMFRKSALLDTMQPSVDMALDLLMHVGSRRNSIITDGGSIVLMSSVAAVRGTPGMSVYSASKGAIDALTLSAAMELAPRRIRVNAIRAGAFESPMHTRLMARTTQHAADDYAAKHPLGFGRADDIANMAVYLLSDAGRWITGSLINVDGGFSAK